MKPLLILLALSISALSADPVLSRPEDLMALIPADLCPKGKQEWDALRTKEASDAMLSAGMNKPASFKLRLVLEKKAPGEILTHSQEGKFQWRGDTYRLGGSYNFPAEAMEALLKLGDKEVKVTGVIKDLRLLGGKSPGLWVLLKDCAVGQ